jgi:hypothetical protein
MQIFTVMHHERPLAVVRARHPDDAIEAARELAWYEAHLRLADDDFETREPDDAEMVRWLEMRDDIVLVVDEAA